MRRVAFCIFAALVAGLGLATVLALGTAALTAAGYKSQVAIDQPIAARMQGLGPAVKTAALIGFVLGAGGIIGLFATSKGPDEPSENGRSEV
jgi:hypothetical protein